MELLLPLAILGLAVFVEELLRLWYTSSTLIHRSTTPVTTSDSAKPQTPPPESENIVWVRVQDYYGQSHRLVSDSTLREHGKKARAHSSGI
jgi:hypothetical protein